MTSHLNPAPAPITPTRHPVLIEKTLTYLAWIQADTPAAARRAAEKDPGRFLSDLAACDGAEVDASTDTAVLSEDAAAWLDLDDEAYARLDDYFAAVGACAAEQAGDAA
jgi:hypothetical protein